MPYHLVMDSNGKPLYCTKRYRLVKREKQFQWFGKVHEYLAILVRFLIVMLRSRIKREESNES